jgi:hypothetical protein
MRGFSEWTRERMMEDTDLLGWIPPVAARPRRTVASVAS